MHKNQGFTLIELMIVVSVIGILAGVTIGVINPDYQKRMAEDSVIRKNVYDAGISIETYFAAENSYPAQGTANNPLDSSAATADVAAVYIDVWPAGIVYTLSGNEFSVHAPKSTNTEQYFKYNNTWKEVRECNAVTSVSSCTGPTAPPPASPFE